MSIGSKDGAFKADAKIAAGVDDNLNVHPLNCDETGTLLVAGTVAVTIPNPLPVAIDQTGTNNVVKALQDGTWTVNLATEPTIDIGIVDQGIPNTLSNAWPVEITDGTNVLGTVTHPVNITGTVTTTPSPNVNVHDAAGNPINSTGTSLNVDVTNFPATQSVTQGTSPWVVSGTVTTTPPANASTNLTQVGGAAISEGQKLMAASVPVVIASDQSAIAVTGTITTSPNVNVHDGSGNTIASTGTSLNVDVTNTVPVTLASTTITGTVAVTESGTWSVGVNNFPATQPVSGTVTVVQPTGTNLHTVTDTGSTTAVTGNVTVVQPTGTNLHVVNDASSAVIGHVITDTGSTTAVTGTVAVTESGTWTVQPGNTANTTPWLVTQAPATSGGVSTNVQQSLTSSALVKGSAGQKYGYEVYNPNASAVYVFFYNTTSAPTIGSTTNLLTQMGIPSLSGAIFNHTIGIPFSTGIYVAVSTSPTSAAAPGSGLTITTLYD